MVVRSKHSIKRKRKGTRLNGKTKRTKTVQKGGKIGNTCTFHPEVAKCTQGVCKFFSDTSIKPMKVCTLPIIDTSDELNKITVIIWSDEAEHGKLILGKSTSMYFITQYLPTEDNEIEVRGSFQIDLNTLLTKMKEIESKNQIKKKGLENQMKKKESEIQITEQVVNDIVEVGKTKTFGLTLEPPPVIVEKIEVLKTALTYLVYNTDINEIPLIKTARESLPKLLELLKHINKNYYPSFNIEGAYRKSGNQKQVQEFNLNSDLTSLDPNKHSWYSAVKKLFKNSYFPMKKFFDFNTTDGDAKIKTHFKELFESNTQVYIVFCQFIQNLRLININKYITKMGIENLVLNALLPRMGILSKDKDIKKPFIDKLEHIFNNPSVLKITGNNIVNLISDVNDVNQVVSDMEKIPLPLTRRNAEIMLKDTTPGDYLVRTRDHKTHPFALSVKGKDRVYHYLIIKNNDIYEILGIERTNKDDKSIKGLIQQIKKIGGIKLQDNILILKEHIYNSIGFGNNDVYSPVGEPVGEQVVRVGEQDYVLRKSLNMKPRQLYAPSNAPILDSPMPNISSAPHDATQIPRPRPPLPPSINNNNSEIVKPKPPSINNNIYEIVDVRCNSFKTQDTCPKNNCDWIEPPHDGNTEEYKNLRCVPKPPNNNSRGGTRHKKTRKNKRRYKKSKRTYKKNKRRSNKKQTRKFK